MGDITKSILYNKGYRLNSKGEWAKLAQPTPEPQPPVRVRQDHRPLLNCLESEFLELLKREYTIVIPQSLRFKLGNGVWYKPDFIAWPAWVNSQMKAFEVKGPHMFRGGIENLKVAAHQYPMIKWVLSWKEDGVWRHQEIMP